MHFFTDSSRFYGKREVRIFLRNENYKSLVTVDTDLSRFYAEKNVKFQ